MWQAMVGEAVELADIELRRHNVRLRHYVAARLPPVMADTILIEQVLVNLMKNGAESIAHAERPPASAAWSCAWCPARWKTCRWSSSGCRTPAGASPPKCWTRLFEAFFSTKSEGMGMGLNLCRSIVESHQGRMQAENLYNGSEVTGCRFSFWLPLASACQ